MGDSWDEVLRLRRAYLLAPFPDRLQYEVAGVNLVVVEEELWGYVSQATRTRSGTVTLTRNALDSLLADLIRIEPMLADDVLDFFSLARELAQATVDALAAPGGGK